MPATLTTAASPNVTLSEPVVTLNDSATLSGGANPTGVIVFTLAGPGGFLFTQTDAVSGNAIYNASVTLPTAGTVAGTYSWTAHYSGDAANNSANDQGGSAEQTVVSPASPGLSTTASPGGIAGTTLTDIAHLSGGYLPTGTIIFLLIAPGGLPVDTETVTVNGNGTYTTPTGFTVPTGAVGGTYVWHVLYNGDANNNAATANLENVTVGVNPFPPPGTTADMILRHGADGRYEIYDIGNNSVLAAHPLGQVGTDWKFVGLGGFFGSDTTDMILRNSNTGGLEVYDVNNNNITNAASIGAIGLEWQFSGVGNFSGVPGETDLLLRNSNTGGLEVYDINNNQLTGAAFIGTIGLEWQFAGIAPIHAPGASDLVLRNKNTGAFEAYDISNNMITSAASLGSVGLDWSLGGFAADPPTASMGSSGSTSQLVQAMAAFGGGAADTSNTIALGAETSQQPLLTTPQHA